MRKIDYGFVASASNETDRNIAVQQLKDSGKTIMMPCGAMFEAGNLEERWYEVPCPCLNTSHVLVLVEKRDYSAAAA